MSEAHGTSQTLAQLEILAARITEHYRRNGQFLARAYVPAQAVTDGVVRIAIVEAVYGEVLVNNTSRVDTDRLEAVLAPLRTGRLVTRAPLERSLLFLQELAGIELDAVARPGSGIGLTDLIVTAVDAARMSGNIGLDNQGSAFTGRARANANLNFNNVLGAGEVFSGALLSSGRNLSYARIGLQGLVNSIGSRAGLSAAILRYRLDDAFRSLESSGSAQVLDGFVQHALVRDPDVRLHAELRVEHKKLEDAIVTSNVFNDRTISSVSAGVGGELRSGPNDSTATSFAISYSRGRVRFDDAAALARDRSDTGARVAGGFGRWSFLLTQTRNLGSPELATGTSLFGSLRAQVPSRNLDSSEQISIGGPYGVRGYDINALAGAEGYVVTIELRRALMRNESGAWQGRAFVDWGAARIYKNASTAQPNSAAIGSLGAGLSWTGPYGLTGHLNIAAPIGSDSRIAVERKARMWLLVNSSF